jgi:hypothetical protein
MRCSYLKLVVFSLLLMGYVFIGSGTNSTSAQSGNYMLQSKDDTAITLNGVRFTKPNGYVTIAGNEIANSAFLFNKKYKEGFFIVVPSAPFDEKQLIGDLTNSGLSKFFPKEPQNYLWKPLNDLRKISRFEIGGGKAMGFNKRDLIIVQYHHFRIGDRDIFLGDLFELTRGKEAQEIYDEGLGGESMRGCNDSVEIIYPITGEKIEDNSPCEFTTIRPGS